MGYNQRSQKQEQQLLILWSKKLGSFVQSSAIWPLPYKDSISGSLFLGLSLFLPSLSAVARHRLALQKAAGMDYPDVPPV